MDTIAKLASKHFGPDHPEFNTFIESLKRSAIGPRLIDLEPEPQISPTRQEQFSTNSVVGVIAPKPDEIRCHALTYMVRPNERGVLVPKQCIRAKECGSDFCKQHNVVVNTPCSGCSMNACHDIVHKYQWEHFGTVDRPTWVFEKYADELKANYLKTLEKQKKSSHVAHPKAKAACQKKVCAIRVETVPLKQADTVIIPPGVFMSLRQLSTSVSSDKETEELFLDERVFSQKFSVWVDEDTLLYYSAEKDGEPLGQIVRDKLVPFRRK
jgi:hypothetical protein